LLQTSKPTPGKLIKNLLTLLTGAILLILGLVFSVVAITVIAVLGLLAWGYVWWKTRNLRQAMQQQSTGGRIIEGEATVLADEDSRIENSPPEKRPQP